MRVSVHSSIARVARAIRSLRILVREARAKKIDFLHKLYTVACAYDYRELKMTLKSDRAEKKEGNLDIKKRHDVIGIGTNTIYASLMSYAVPASSPSGEYTLEKVGIKTHKVGISKSTKKCEFTNTIFNKDCNRMDDLPDNSIDLMITSPPYNTTKRYDDDLSLKEYLKFIEDVMREVYRVLKPGGFVAFNIANVGRKPYIPLDCYIIEILQDLGYYIYQEQLWNKAASSGGSCAWGSWQSASNPSLRDVHEYIIIAVKGNVGGDILLPLDEINDIPKKLDKRAFSLNIDEFFTNIWGFNTESAKRVNHPAPFPVEFPYRVILIFSKKGDIVLDPFMGSGSVAIAALSAGRNYVGYELEPEYVKIANDRIGFFTNYMKK